MNTNILMRLVGILFLSSACTSQIDTAEQNKNLTLKANQEILNNGNIAYVDSVFADDYRNNGSEMGKKAIKNFASSLLEAFPDLEVTIEPIVAEGNLVAWQRTHTGTHQGQILGIPASNKQLTWQSLVITRVSNGIIVEEWSQGNFRQKLEAVSSEN